MKYVKCILVLCLTAISIYCDLSAYTSLYVQDPRQTWRYDQGTIDEAVISVTPSGAYFEIGLYLTFSAKNTSYTNPSDTLEVQFFFNLPENAHIIDSWLWVEDTIVKAMLIERSEATLIYEGIVKRRRDPSVLYKNSPTNYEMRIFPLPGNKSRKVKITYLVPADWSNSYVRAALPVPFLTLSKVKLSSYQLKVYESGKFKNPVLPELSGVTFTPAEDSLFGKHLTATIFNSPSQLSIAYDSPLINGAYLSTFQAGNNAGYYQLVVVPKLALNFHNTKKILFLIDYDAAKTNMSRQEVISNVKTSIMENLNPLDSFDIILSGTEGKSVFDGWMSVKSDSIVTTLNNIKQTDLEIFTNLPSLLVEGVEYIKNHGRDGIIVIISPSDALGSNKVVNPFLEELNTGLDFTIQYNIADYGSLNIQSYYFGNKYFNGNQYLYEYLSKSSGGYYIQMNNTGYTFSNLLNTLFGNLDGNVQSFELYTSVKDGFCYGRYYLSANSQPIYSNSAVFQFGKFEGSMPFSVKATGFFRSHAFSKEITIAETDIDEHDKIDKQIWTAQYIDNLESGTMTNDIISEITLASKTNRVLSIYTAFLALEPYMMPDENDEQPNSVAENSVSDFAQMTAYPNPFTDKMNIQIKLIEVKGLKVHKIEVLNILGQTVKNFAVENSLDFEIAWDGSDNSGNAVDKGTYFIVLTTNAGKLVCKVIKI